MSTMLNEFSTTDQNQLKDHTSEQNDLSLKSGQGLGGPPEFSLDGHTGKQDGPPLLYLRPSTVTNLSLLMKKFEESDLTSDNIDTSELLQDDSDGGISCSRLEDTIVLDHGGITEGSELHLAAQDLMFYSDVKKACYLAPTPPASDYDDLCLSDASPAGTSMHPGDMSASDLLSPPLSIRSGLEFQDSPKVLHYPSPASSNSPNSTMTMSPSPILASPGGELSYGACSGPSFNLSPLSQNSGSPNPADQINHQQGCITDQEPSTSFPSSSSSDPYHVSQSTPNFAITSSSQMGYPLVNTTVFSTGNLQHSHQALLTTQAGATISFIPTSAVDEINAINIIELSLLKDSRHGKRSITSQPLPREALCGLADNNKLISSNANIKQEPTCKMCASTLCRCSTPMDNIGDHNLLNIKTKYEENMLISLPTSPLSEVDVKSNKIYSSKMPIATSNALSLCSSRDSMPSCSSSNRSLNTSSCVVKESVASDCSTRRSATVASARARSTSSFSTTSESGESSYLVDQAVNSPTTVDKESSAGDSLDDIPTLSDLAKQSPKLSTWRLTRIVSEKLEQHLWIWRCACKKSGKRISKSLLQARAKWAFRKAGIIEFKASDGWYWKWLAKWRRKGEEIGVKEQGQLTQQELKILPYSTTQQTTIKTEGNFEKSVTCECSMEGEDSVDNKMKSNIKIQPSQDMNDEKCVESESASSQTSQQSHQNIPQGHHNIHQGHNNSHQGHHSSQQESFPNQIIPVQDILPLTLAGDEITLAPTPTESSLPVSPIFIRNGSLPQTESSNDLLGEYSSVVEGLEAEFPNLNCEYLNLDSLCNWQPCDMDDIDTDTLVRSLSSQCKPSLSSLTSSIKPEESKSNKMEIQEGGVYSMCDSHDAHTDQQTNDTIRHKIKTETCDTDMDVQTEVSNMSTTSSSSFLSTVPSSSSFSASSSSSSSMSLCNQSLKSCLSPHISCISASSNNNNNSNSQSHLAGICSTNICSSSSCTAGTSTISSTGVSNMCPSSSSSDSSQGLCFVTSSYSCDIVPTSCGTTSSNNQGTLPSSPCESSSSNGGGGGTAELTQEICGANCRKLKQSTGGDRVTVPGDMFLPGPSPSPSPNSKPVLTTIAIYKKRGEESLNKFKDEVRKYAVDHTFKETAKRFGIHHSTVSGWVKESEKLDKSSTQNSFFKERGDEKFIHWLREYRYQNKPVTLTAVKNKVADILMEYTVTEIEKTCKWFLLWHNRREERLYVEGMEDEDMKKETQNLAYPPAFKLEVALFAKKHSQYAAAKIFNVARRRIFDWMRQIPKLEELIAKGHMKKMTGRGPKNRDIDQALYSWYCDRKARGNRPKSCHVQSKARELYLTYGYRDMKCSYGWFKRWSQRFQIQLRYSYDDEILEWIMSRFDENKSVTAQELQTYGLSLIQREDPGFKASSGWALRFCKRHKEYMDSDTSFSNTLPQHLDSRVKTFRRVLHQLQQEKRFAYSSIGSVDELTFNFNSILEKRPGCLLKHTGLDTADICVILSVLADGTLLNPMLIFKSDSSLSCDNKLLQGGGVGGGGVRTETSTDTQTFQVYQKGSVVVLEKGVATTRPNNITSDPSSILSQGLDAQNLPLLTPLEFSVWLERVWFSHVTTPSFLLADSFSVHTADLTKKLVLKEDSVLAIIPRACSSKLQPLHQGIKIRFRTHLEEMFLSTVKTSIGKGEGKPTPSKDLIIQWVTEAWHAIKEDKEEIIRSFKRADIFHT